VRAVPAVSVAPVVTSVSASTAKKPVGLVVTVAAAAKVVLAETAGLAEVV
jgi:hypothetical protein